MISKRILLATLCFAVLFGAFGVYSYSEISSLRNHTSDLETQIDNLEAERDSLQNNVSTLESQVNALQEEIAHLQNELSHTNSTRTFIREWSSEEQDIVNGTLRMELTFTWNEENLSIIAKINDDEYNSGDYLGLVGDLDGNGTIDEAGCMLFSANTTLPGLITTGGMLFCPFYMAPFPSPCHTCIFETGVGYTFNGWGRNILGDLIHVCFYDEAIGGGVYVRFHFRMEKAEGSS